MDRVVVISELDAVGAFDRFVEELRTRRDDLDRHWRAAGVAAHATWVEPEAAIVITQIQAPSVRGAREALAAAGSPFLSWYRNCEQRLLGTSPIDPDHPVASRLFDHQVDEPDPFDLFMVAAWPLLPDRVEEYRRTVERRSPDERATARLQRWQLKRYTIWMQTTARATWAIFDGVGDLAHMLRDLSSSPDPEMEWERQLIREMYGVDLTTTGLNLPRAAWSWTA